MHRDNDIIGRPGLGESSSIHTGWEQALLVTSVTRRTASIVLVVSDEVDDAIRGRCRAAVIIGLAAHAIDSLRVGV